MDTKLIITGSDTLLLAREGGGYRLPLPHEVAVPADAETFPLGHHLAADILSIPTIPDGMERKGLRESWNLLEPDDYSAAAKGAELINWNREERFCAADGTPLLRSGEISKKCPTCGREYFPRLNPAIVVLVTKDDEALLVHARTLRRDVMALVAGFVETGETLEQCVAREVREETSLEISDIRYFGSQSWPFPHQLMVGFTAKYSAGEINFADGELSAGSFFKRGSMPELPSLPSLSRRIIDAWTNGEIC